MKLTDWSGLQYGMYGIETEAYPDSKVHGANMGPIWDRQDPGEPHVGPMNFVIWVYGIKWWKSLTEVAYDMGCME